MDTCTQLTCQLASHMAQNVSICLFTQKISISNGSCQASMNFLEMPEKDGRKMNSFVTPTGK